MSHKRTLFGDLSAHELLPIAERAFVEVSDGASLLPHSRTPPHERRRVFLGFIGGVVLFGLLFLRLGELQILEGERFRNVAENNRLQAIVNPAHRGRLYDRFGTVLAQNDPDYRFMAFANLLPEDEDQFMALLAPLTISCGLLTSEMYARFTEAVRAKEQEVVLAEHVSSDCALRYLAGEVMPTGVHVEVHEERAYITDRIPSLAHALGYVGKLSPEEYTELRQKGYRSFDSIGKQGVEALFEERLRGKNGESLREVDAQGGVLRVLLEQSPLQGEDLTLSLDAELNAVIDQVFAERLKTAPVKRAAVVVMKPDTGEVLALASYPSFDANDFVGGIDAQTYAAYIHDVNAPLFNRSLAGSYPAGSTIKPLYAAGALTDHLITPQTAFVSSGGIWLGNRFFPDWRSGGHGITNVYHAIADSVNTFFYTIGGGAGDFVGMGVERLMYWASVFGLGQKTGIGLLGDGEGFLPSKAWKEETRGEPWYVGDTYNVSIGQGDVLVSPLQMTRAIGAIAERGVLVTPTLLKDVQGEAQTILDADVADVVRDAMLQTVRAGTARMMQDVAVPVAGKTGTAQWSSTAAPHSWFTGFAPFDDPEIVITVIVEQGGDQTLASFVAHDILVWYFSRLDARESS